MRVGEWGVEYCTAEGAGHFGAEKVEVTGARLEIGAGDDCVSGRLAWPSSTLSDAAVLHRSACVGWLAAFDAC